MAVSDANAAPMYVVGEFLDGKYSVIELSDTSTGLRAEICPERGGLVCSLALGDREALYLDRQSFEDGKKNVRGGIPILFPVCGPLQDGIWPYQNLEYKMPQHGLARQAHWEIVHSGSDTCAWTELRMVSTLHTMEQFPFDFEVLFRYELAGRTLTLKQSYSNRSDKPMPFQTGLHPYFCADKSKPMRWQVPASRYVDNDAREDGEQAYPGNVPATERSVDWQFGDISKFEASVYAGCEFNVRMRFSEHYKYVVVWSLKDDNFVCLEPWSGPRFGFNSGQDLLVCNPGEHVETWVAFDLEEEVG